MSTQSGQSYFDESEFNAKEYISTVYPSARGSENFKGGYDFRWEQLNKFFTKYNSNFQVG